VDRRPVASGGRAGPPPGVLPSELEAQITGSLFADGARLVAPRRDGSDSGSTATGYALDLTEATVGSDVRISQGSLVVGGLSLEGVTITGGLDLSTSAFVATEKSAIRGVGMTVKGALNLAAGVVDGTAFPFLTVGELELARGGGSRRQPVRGMAPARGCSASHVDATYPGTRFRGDAATVPWRCCHLNLTTN
jgi:hypothetical protein